jgi:hypothetical protein
LSGGVVGGVGGVDDVEEGGVVESTGAGTGAGWSGVVTTGGGKVGGMARVSNSAWSGFSRVTGALSCSLWGPEIG